MLNSHSIRLRVAGALLKDHASPEPRVPAEATAANHRCWRYDSRRHHNRRSRYYYDRSSVRPTSSIRPTVVWRMSA